MSTDATDRLDDRGMQLDAAIGRWAPAGSLVIGTALTPMILDNSPGYWLLTGGLVVTLGLWSYVLAVRPAPGPAAEGCGPGGPVWASQPRVGAIYVAGFLLLMGTLCYLSPFYAFLAFAGYAHSYEYLRGRWRFAGIAATAVATAYGQMGGSLADFTPIFVIGWFAVAVLNAVVAGALTYVGALTIERSVRRGKIIEELNEANRQLAETLEENAVLHARLLAQAREAGVIDERARMAREIHDTIAQGLTGIVTQLEAADAADGESEVRRRHIDVARSLARESLTEARRSVEALAPGQLAQARLPDAIAEMAKKWAETAGVHLTVDTTGDPRPLVPDIEVTLFRVAQEALANVGKHAGATRVGLTLSYMDDVVVLDVRDDGVGFVVEGLPLPTGGSGFGLAAMEQRVRRVSGTFCVESAVGEGAAVSASVPAIPAEVRA